MKPKTPPCTDCKHQTFCIQYQIFCTQHQILGKPKTCGYKNKQLDRILIPKPLIKTILKLNSITLKSPKLCQKLIEPTFKSTQTQTNQTCQACAHYIFNCEGKKP